MKTAEEKPLLPKEQKINHKNNVVLFVTITLYACSLQMGYSVLVQFIHAYVEDHLEYNTTQLLTSPNYSQPNKTECGKKSTSGEENEIQKKSADWIWYLEITEYTLAIPAMAFSGTSADYLGRKPFILMPIFGNTVLFVISFLIAQFELSINYFFVGYAVAGICGMHYVFYLSIYVVGADTTPKGKSRSFYFTFLYLNIAIGLVSAQIGTGYFIKYTGFKYPFLTAVGICFLSFLVVFLFMDETLDKTIVKKEKKSPLKALKNLFMFYYDERQLIKGCRKWKFILCAVTLFFMVMASNNRNAVDLLYLMGDPFCFSASYLGWYGAINDSLQLMLGTIILKILHCCMSDEIITVIGCLSGIACYIILGLATGILEVFVACACGVLNTLPLPLMKSILSRMVDESKQGALFANIFLIETLVRLSGSTLFLNIFGNTQSFMKGFVYFVFALFSIVGILLFIPVVVSNKRERRKEYNLYVNSPQYSANKE